MGALKRKLKTMFTTKRSVMKWLVKRKFFRFVPDKLALKIIYKNYFYKKLNLKNPKTFNEKLQWLKLYNRNPLYTTLVDKYAVKEYVANIIGEEHIIPTLGVWDKFDDIDFDALPDQFVLKCTHSSGDLVICKDKTTFDKAAAKKKLESFLKKDFYKIVREWPYKNVPRRIIAEKYMSDGINDMLVVYKVFNFNGEPKIIQTIQGDKTKQESIDYFDTEWNLLELKQNFPNSTVHMGKPICLNEILNFAAKCSVGFPFLRTDWYEINGKVYFSEFTFFSDSGLGTFHPESWNEILGEWITLPKKRK